MIRIVDYEARKKAVLAAAIDRYIDEAEPVASENMTEQFGLSSATIRNIFSELEETGYLSHPYTSAGRTPTDKGYRYYVDFLISQIELLNEHKLRIIKELKQEIKRLEDVLERTSEVISTITRYAGIVSLLDWQDKYFFKGISFILEQPEFQDLSRIRYLIKIIEGRQQLLEIINRDFSGKVKVYIGEELGCPEMKECSLAVSSYKVRKKPIGRLAVLGPVRMEYNHIIPALEYISDVLTDVLDEI